MSKYPDSDAAMSARKLEPVIHGFVASLAKLVETHVAHQLQKTILTVLVNRGAAPKRNVSRASTRLLSASNAVRRGTTATPKMVKARKIQGQYMAALRGLSPADRNRVDKLTRVKGVVSGLALARSLGQGPKRSRNASRPLAVVKPGGTVTVTRNQTKLIRSANGIHPRIDTVQQ
jgi:hypothetical protein